MDFAKLITKKNLKLAWRRITSSKDARYKAFFRHILEAYELSYKENIDDLRHRLKNKEYVAQPPLRFYVPKPSGLQRPITLLYIEDQIVLQALTNLFAEKVRQQRGNLSGQFVFSNVLGKIDSPFFLEEWKKGFSRLKRMIKAKFDDGYVWIATFDISAFYDTIPHELLLKVLVPRAKGSLYEDARTWLKTWSSDKPSDHHNHGIPQGPMASDFLAECVLLDIDEKMSSKYVYFRYVDDIRILGKTELEVRQALVELDILCKSKGLIPNSDKTKIKKVSNASGLVEDIPEIARYFEDGNGQSLTRKTAEKIILDSIEQNEKITVIDRTLLRYVLFRAPASDEILQIVLSIWEHYPEHTDAYVAFLENYQRSDGIIELVTRLLNSEYPYDYVQGELWKLVARMGKPNELRQLKETAIKTVKNPSSGHASRFGAQIFLCKCDEIGLGEYEKWLIYEKKALVQAFVAPYLRLDSESGKAAGKAILSRSAIDGYLGLVKPIIDANLTPAYFARNPENFPLVAQFTYKAAGLAGHIIPKADAIGNLLAKRYAIQKWNKWQDLFLGEYGHAHMILQLADTYFDTHFTSWLNYQDTFNEILFHVFQEFLARKGAPGAISLTRNGERIKYGVLLNNTPNFKASYPNIQDGLYKIHRRRNHLPSSHAYDEKTGDKAKPLKKKEQGVLKLYVDDALKEIITIVDTLGI